MKTAEMYFSQFCRLGELCASVVLVRTLFHIADSPFFVASSHGRKRVRKLSGVSLIRALIPFLRAPPS